MRIFEKLFRKRENLPFFLDSDLLSPVDGVMIPAFQISDSMFAEELLGQTIAIEPKNGTIVCPVNGIVEVAFPTKHAFGIRGNDGNAYLVHIGVDTVTLNGKGFNMFLKQGDTVKAGQKAVEVDLELIRSSGLDVTIILIVTDRISENFSVDYVPFGLVNRAQKINK